MKLSMFSVVHERGDAAPLLDDPLIHCQAGQQLVLAYAPGAHGLLSHSRRQTDHTAADLVVDRNLDAFKHIIEGKYERGEWAAQKRLGQSEE